MGGRGKRDRASGPAEFPGLDAAEDAGAQLAHACIQALAPGQAREGEPEGGPLLGAGADTVSIGEIERSLAAGVPPERVVFSGVGKTRDEMARALLPVAAAMAQLVEETRRTLEEIAEESREAQRLARTSMDTASKEAARVMGDLQASALKLEARIQGYLTAAQTPPPPPPNPWIPAVVSPVLLCGLAILARHLGWL